jgi:hypothetical protein
MRKCFRLGVSLTAVTMSLFWLPSVALSQANENHVSQDTDVDAEIAAIIDGILKHGEQSLGGGITASTWVPPSPDEIEQIRKIGHDAISSLNRALDSHRPFQQFLVVRLLGAIGGADVVPPLRRALERDKQNSVRMAALAALRSAPDNLAVPIIQSTVHDPDPLVAKRARDLLTDYYDLSVPH